MILTALEMRLYIVRPRTKHVVRAAQCAAIQFKRGQRVEPMANQLNMLLIVQVIRSDEVTLQKPCLFRNPLHFIVVFSKERIGNQFGCKKIRIGAAWNRCWDRSSFACFDQGPHVTA
jgi:hypothetical protein